MRCGCGWRGACGAAAEPVDMDALDRWARAEVKAAQERRAALREARQEAGVAKLRAQQAEDQLAAARAQIAALEAAHAETEAARAAAAAEKDRLEGEMVAKQAELAETAEKNRQWQEVRPFPTLDSPTSARTAATRNF